MSEYVAENIYSIALTAVAMGATRNETREYCLAEGVSPDLIDTEMTNALRDALKQGVEREDIDPSWFA